jgi:DNA-directed RNA polymerase subunit alpha
MTTRDKNAPAYDVTAFAKNLTKEQCETLVSIAKEAGLIVTVTIVRECYYWPIEDLNLTVRALNCLKAEGIATVGQLAEARMSHLLKIPSFGKKCCQEVNDALGTLDLTTGMILGMIK